METSESQAFSFVIKIWMEETLAEDGRVTWRGHITHVPGAERRYFDDLGDIHAFIAPYLQRSGVRLGTLWSFRLWMRGLKKSGQRPT